MSFVHLQVIFFCDLLCDCTTRLFRDLEAEKFGFVSLSRLRFHFLFAPTWGHDPILTIHEAVNPWTFETSVGLSLGGLMFQPTCQALKVNMHSMKHSMKHPMI